MRIEGLIRLLGPGEMSPMATRMFGLVLDKYRAIDAEDSPTVVPRDRAS